MKNDISEYYRVYSSQLKEDLIQERLTQVKQLRKQWMEICTIKCLTEEQLKEELIIDKHLYVYQKPFKFPEILSVIRYLLKLKKAD